MHTKQGIILSDISHHCLLIPLCAKAGCAVLTAILFCRELECTSVLQLI